jgi:tRNA pseudouridine38/39 synthase
LRLAYLGQTYNGFEHHNNNTTPLPTIEEELYKALTKTNLIFPTAGVRAGSIDWEGCEYSKCGRTDRGVSAFGQVIGIRVRSSRPKIQPRAAASSNDEDSKDEEGNRTHPEREGESGWHHIRDELSYPRILNRVLPPTIRILAWCPSPPEDFSARFSCRERRYKYFFTSPAYTPSPHTSSGLRRRRTDGEVVRDGWLDIEAMREAAAYYVGSHDFRNFCKVDPGKGITNFERRMFRASIDEVSPGTSGGLPSFLYSSAFAPGPSSKSTENGELEKPKLYTFTLHGSAFLWHQVRHMVAMLFLVGQGLESPTLVRDMLDINITPTKPLYEMADDAPLVLWDCIFPDLEAEKKFAGEDGWRMEAPAEGFEDCMKWVYIDEQGGANQDNSGATAKAQGIGYAGAGDGRFGPGGLQEVVWAEWRRKKIDEVLAGSLLNIVAQQSSTSSSPALPTEEEVPPFETHSTKIFDGGNMAKLRGEYVPVLQRPRQESVEVQTQRYFERKGLPVRGKAVDADVDE